MGSAAFLILKQGSLITSNVVPIEKDISNNVCEYQALINLL